MTKGDIMKFNENIFRSNDIRGIYKKDFDEEFAKKIGRALATFFEEKNKDKDIVVGCDIRIGSESLKKSLIESLTASGYNVTDIGIVTTPILYFAVKHLKRIGGVMITGSHLPAEFNGFKIVDENGNMIGSETGLEKIKQIIIKEEFSKPKKIGIAKKYEKIFDDYSNFILKKIKIKKKLKVVLDLGNSVSGLITPKLFEKTGCEVATINSELDGTFPYRPPEPRPENLQKLQEAVKANKADFGVAYDGDGDRIVFVDDEGNVLDSSSLVIMIFAEHYLNKQKNSKIVFDLGCSMAVGDTITKLGGTPIETRVGTSFIKSKMVEENAIFGGESSSHMYFAETFNFDDAAFASLKMAEIISELGEGLSSKIKSLPSFPYFPEWEFECPDEKKQAALQKIKDKFKTSGIKFSELDGLKLIYEDGWVLWRPSGTRPSMKIYVEAKTPKRLEELKNFAKDELIKAINA